MPRSTGYMIRSPPTCITTVYSKAHHPPIVGGNRASPWLMVGSRGATTSLRNISTSDSVVISCFSSSAERADVRYPGHCVHAPSDANRSGVLSQSFSPRHSRSVLRIIAALPEWAYQCSGVLAPLLGTLLSCAHFHCNWPRSCPCCLRASFVVRSSRYCTPTAGVAPLSLVLVLLVEWLGSPCPCSFVHSLPAACWRI